MNPIDGINERNSQIFRTFFERNFSSLLQFAEKYVDDTETAADIAQECFIRLWYGDFRFDNEEKARGFLYTTARNLALNRIRHNNVAARYARMSLLESEPYFQENVMEEEVYIMVRNAVGRLADQSRRIILLALQGNTSAEIAQQLGISINTVNTLKKNAYKKLRGILKDSFGLLFIVDVTRLC